MVRDLRDYVRSQRIPRQQEAVTVIDSPDFVKVKTEASRAATLSEEELGGFLSQDSATEAVQFAYEQEARWQSVLEDVVKPELKGVAVRVSSAASASSSEFPAAKTRALKSRSCPVKNGATKRAGARRSSAAKAAYSQSSAVAAKR